MLDENSLINTVINYTFETYPQVYDFIDYYNNIDINKMSNDDIYRELCWIVYNSGFKYDIIKKYWGDIGSSLNDFDVNKMVYMNEDIEYYANHVCNISKFNNIVKAKWCIYNANRLIELDVEKKEHGGFKKYLSYLSKNNKQTLIEMTPYLINDFQFKGIGKVTIFHFMKNMGLDIFKPDIHLCRILTNLNIMNEKDLSLNTIYQAMIKISAETNLSLKELDTIFFFYGMLTSDTSPQKLRKK